MAASGRVRVSAVSDRNMEASPNMSAAASVLSGNEHQESSPESSARAEPTESEPPARGGREFGGGGDRDIDDVTRPMRRQAGRAGGGRGQGRTKAGILNKKGASLLEGEGEKFAQLPEDEDGLHTRRDHERGEGAGTGSGGRGSPVGDVESFGNGIVRDPTETSASPLAAAMDAEGGVADSERLAFRRKGAEVV